MRATILSLLLGLMLSGAAAAQSLTVVELYTSQGCSSCPPAEALLQALAQADPGLLPLDLHVTYWDRLGWKDPFSLSAATERQQRFSQRQNLDTVYTPQAIVDGRYQAVGSDRAALTQAIARARADHPAVTLSIGAGPSGVHAHVGPGAGHATLLLAGIDRAHTTVVRGGENGGRTLPEINVVRALAPAGTWSGAPLDADLPRPEGDRAALLLQADDGRILAAAVTP